MKRQRVVLLISLAAIAIALVWTAVATGANTGKVKPTAAQLKHRDMILQQRNETKKQLAAAADFQAAFDQAAAATPAMAQADVPHYFGPYPNYANSPMPTGGIGVIAVDAPGSGYTGPTVMVTDLYTGTSTAVATATVVGGEIIAITVSAPGSGYTAPVVEIADPTGTGAAATATIGGTLSGGIKKFVDPLPSIPVAVPDTTTYPGSDYYEIELGQYSQQLHSDLPATTLRGYRQVNVDPADPAFQFTYLGPTILAQRDRPVRVKFVNNLPTGAGGNLFIPVDETIMGAGMGPDGTNYSQNRATVHLHGNNSVWISDGTPHQWTTPAGEATSYPKGVSVYNVPGMPNAGKSAVQGELTFYYTNAQSARLQFYHDHAYGITRLNVYAGEAAGYLITDQVEQDLITGSNDSGVNPGLAEVLPDVGIPLVIQDKSFVDASTIPFQDPTWRWGTGADGDLSGYPDPKTGDLWFPHIYMPNQNPWDPSGMNAFGRWHYGPWFWPPATNITNPPVANEYYDPINAPWEPPLRPDTPDPSSPAEGFMDTPLVNGKAYPYLEVQPKTYRFRILNAANDRFFNLQWYQADPAFDIPGQGLTEVRMVPAIPTAGFPADWPTDSREGGVPDPATAGPEFVQIGNEGGFLPAPAVLPNLPVDWNMDQTNFDMGLVNQGTLILGTAERADVLVDFSQYAGQTLILYNDAPAPFPAIDARYDYHTGGPDLTSIGGTPTTQPGYGPNTRTIMQVRVADATADTALDVDALEATWAKGTGTSTKRGVFEVSQDEIIVPTAVYDSAYGKSFPNDQYARIFDVSKTFTTVAGATVTMPFAAKAIQDEMGEAFDTQFGRMSAMLGLELPASSAGNQNFMLYPYNSPPVEIVKNTIYGTPIGGLADGTQFWKITHNGVDTHTIHTHLYNVQIVNRVAWDNARRLPDPNELGWKETLRVNPLQDTIVAFRAVAPAYDPTGTAAGNTIPFKVPNSVRPIDVTKPLGAPLDAPLGGFKDPNGQPVTVNNELINYGWEYVFHCHLLAHEEMDMMHSVVLGVSPDAPSNLVASLVGNGNNRRAVLTWADNSVNETGFTIERATNDAFSGTLATFAVGPDVTTFSNTIGNTNQTYYYRVFASNTVGGKLDGTPAAAGFPTETMRSAFSNTAGVNLPPAAPSNVVATAFRFNTNSDRVTVTWQDNSANETGFRIVRASDANFTIGVSTSTVGANATTFTTGNLPRGATYYFRVQAYNASGTSAWVNGTPFPITTP